MKRMLFILNPGAGRGETGGLEQMIDRQFRRSDIEYQLHYLEEDDPLGRIRELIEGFNPDTLVAAGGDGTINLAATAIRDRSINLGIIPAGSANGLAYELGIPSDLQESMKIISKGKVRSLDVLMINERHLCLHLSDLGLNARVVRRYDQEDIRGFYGYARQYGRELSNRKKFRCEVESGGKVIRAKSVMVVLANGSYYGTGASITIDGKPDDGWFEVVLIHAYPFWFLFYMFISIFTQRFNDNRFRKIIRCRKATISVAPQQELQVDGEHIGPEEKVTVQLLPGRINIISVD